MNKEEQLMTKFRDLFNKMGWLNEFNMTDSLKGYTPSEVHCVEAIEKNKYPNVRKLAESLYMTRGAISKLTKRLIKKGLIERYQKPDNKKKIYFRIKEQGKKKLNKYTNVRKLAESIYMTRGDISKLTKRLIKKGLIERYQKPDNKKEIYFRLTEQGKIIFDIHENLHKSFLERDKIVFESMSD